MKPARQAVDSPSGVGQTGTGPTLRPIATDAQISRAAVRQKLADEHVNMAFGRQPLGGTRRYRSGVCPDLREVSCR